MNKFEYGQRVAFYKDGKRFIGEIIRPYHAFSIGDRYWVREIKGSESEHIVHYKQCRRLVKKKPEVYWVQSAYLHKKVSIGEINKVGYVKVKLVNDGKVPITGWKK